MNTIDNLPAAEEHDAAASIARTGFRHRVFSCRTLVGLLAVAVGCLLVNPRNFYGDFDLAVKCFSVALVLAGLALRAWGAASAGRHTRTAAIEASQLATGGPYAYVRNPIYLGSMILGLGSVGLLNDPMMLLLYILTFAVLYISIIPAEEAFLRRKFPAEYARYSAAVPRLIPRLRPWSGAQQRSLDWVAAKGEVRVALLLILIFGSLWVALWIRGVR
jgi:protein-S-isoprenylcysteine O-methyltransferase Ste14